MSDVRLLGRDHFSQIARDTSIGINYRLTECCSASAKGMEGGTGCRACYAYIDSQYGEVLSDEYVLENIGVAL